MNSWSNAGPKDNRRRSLRVILSIPVTVFGTTAQGPFEEATQTLVINAHGALLALKAKISQGQKLQLKSATHPEKKECSVVYVGPTADGRTQLGVEFTQPSPRFWQISFPPEDWAASQIEDPVVPAAKTAK